MVFLRSLLIGALLVFGVNGLAGVVVSDANATGVSVSSGVSVPVKVGNVALATPEWQSRLTDSQFIFYDALISAPNIEWNDGVPYDRRVGLYESGDLDCIVGPTYFPREGKVFSDHEIRFEMVMFGRRGESLLKRDTITVGYLATLPRFDLPFVQPVEWYGLRTIQQGTDLIKIGRIDVLIAHNGFFDGDPVIEEMPFPPVHAVDLTLQCHDTPSARTFLAAFDARLRHEYDNSDSRTFEGRLGKRNNVS